MGVLGVNMPRQIAGPKVSLGTIRTDVRSLVGVHLARVEVQHVALGKGLAALLLSTSILMSVGVQRHMEGQTVLEAEGACAHGTGIGREARV